MGKQAVDMGANTFAFFTRNPRGGSAKKPDVDDINKLIEIMKAGNFGKLVVHAPYTMNLCSDKEDVRRFGRHIMADDLLRLEALPYNYYNFHPGCHMKQGIEKGIEFISDQLNDIIAPQQKTTVLLETMAGKGTEIGGKFEELSAIIDRVELRDKIGVCFDTCHVWDAGYNIADDLDGVLGEFDRTIGIEYLKAIHLNDSMNPCGSHKDRHERLGLGHIGIKALINVINHPILKGLPVILETPNDINGYIREIKVLRENYS